MTLTNSVRHPRKSLAEQIDRLDRILDGLSDNLSEAVATAVQQAVTAAVQEAVRQAVIEVVTNQELQQLLRPPARQPAPTAPAGVSSRGWLGAIGSTVVGVAVQAWGTVRTAAVAAGGWL